MVVEIRRERFDFEKEYMLEDHIVRLTPLRIKHIQELSKISKDPDIWNFFF